MSPGKFDSLLRLFSLLIVKQITKLLAPILAERHLLVTISYVALIDSQISLGVSLISIFVPSASK